MAKTIQVMAKTIQVSERVVACAKTRRRDHNRVDETMVESVRQTESMVESVRRMTRGPNPEDLRARGRSRFDAAREAFAGEDADE